MTEHSRILTDAPEPGPYRHYKGGLYEVVATARHTETGEPLVVYRAGDEWWCRPLASFTGWAQVNGGRIPRFKAIADGATPHTPAAAERSDAETGRPRCPRCQMPHDLTPDSMGDRVCRSILAALAETARLHDEGDHIRCARVDCEAVREQAAKRDAVTEATG